MCGPQNIKTVRHIVRIVRRTETSATVFQSARLHVPEGLNLHQRRCENLTLRERCTWRVVNTAPAKHGVSGKTMRFPHTTYPSADLYSAFVVSCSLSSPDPRLLLRDVVKLEGIWKEAVLVFRC